MVRGEWASVIVPGPLNMQVACQRKYCLIVITIGFGEILTSWKSEHFDTTKYDKKRHKTTFCYKGFTDTNKLFYISDIIIT